MSGVVRTSHLLYSALLILYPTELRKRFGPEMSDVFGKQVRDAWVRRGLRAVARVWWLALWEVLTIALPARLCSAEVVAPVLSGISSLALVLLFLWSVSQHCHR